MSSLPGSNSKTRNVEFELRDLDFVYCPLYTRSQGWKNLGPSLSIFGFFSGPKLLINATTLATRFAN
jgi:hypothetical protein